MTPFNYISIVEGDNFYDRTDETKRIVDALAGGNNIVLFAPRRYGKTSLVFRAMQRLEQHEVSAEESAIFDAAVDGYPMLHAKATKVAVRAIPDGTEYLFTAVDLPREGAPEMPTHELQVYVTVANGETPVFTQVIR